MNIFIHAYNTNFSQCPCPQNPSQNSSNNITNYQHCQNSISHQHCPNYAMTKKTTLPKCSKAKITTWSIIQCLKFQQYQTIKWQCLTIKLSMKHETTFCQTKEPKKKLTLTSMWEYGAWVLGSWRSPSSFHSNDGCYFLPREVRKNGPLEEDDILMQRKDGFENGFHQKWVCSKSSQEHKDLKKYWGRWVKEGWEA